MKKSIIATLVLTFIFVNLVLSIAKDTHAPQTESPNLRKQVDNLVSQIKLLNDATQVGITYPDYLISSDEAVMLEKHNIL